MPRVPRAKKCAGRRSEARPPAAVGICGIRSIFPLVAFSCGILPLAAFDGRASLSVQAADLALEAAQLAEEAAFFPVEVPAALRAVQRAEAIAQAAQETGLELDLGLLADDLRMHPTLIRRQAKLVDTDVQRIEDDFNL